MQEDIQATTNFKQVHKRFVARRVKRLQGDECSAPGAVDPGDRANSSPPGAGANTLLESDFIQLS